MAYADYEFYKTTYFGTAISPEDFPGVAERASEYVDYITKNQSKDASAEALESVKKSVCAIAEILQNESQLSKAAFSADRTVSSESVGGWSRSFGSASPSNIELQMLAQKKTETLQIYLAPHGMLQMRSRR